LSDAGYGHEVAVEDDDELAEVVLPKCHLVVSLMKRWILGTLQGSVGKDHLQDYLNEFTFRFNRRTSKSRGLLFYRLAQLAVVTAPNPRSKIVPAQDVVSG
ncbi:MAG: transposase, partial [Kiritimatiellia bacterium]